MEDSRPTHAYANSGFPSQVPISCCSIYRGLFISKAYETDAKVQSFLSNVSDGKSREAEDDLDTEVVQ